MRQALICLNADTLGLLEDLIDVTVITPCVRLRAGAGGTPEPPALRVDHTRGHEISIWSVSVVTSRKGIIQPTNPPEL
jgi:hypothetical protein